MEAESPKIDQDQVSSPYAQEIEYALSLQRMINKVKEDPSQMRLAIYDFARARLKIDSSWLDKSERERLLTSLETAIRGVEDFSLRHEEVERLPPPSAPPQIGTEQQQSSTAVARIDPLDSTASDISTAPDIPIPNRVYRQQPDIQIVEVLRPSRLPVVFLWVFAIAVAAVVAAGYYRERIVLLVERSGLVAKPVSTQVVSRPDTGSAVGAISPAPQKGPDFPLPSDYGIYALNGESLSELSLVPVRVPDKRIAMSTPITEPSRTVVSDGKVRFVLFRRDLVGNAPERVEVRVVARVARALTFDSHGKPNFTPVSDAWNIRNVSYEFRVRPIPGNPEMLLVQSEKSDFALPSGRYVLVLKEQGYDFTVAGEVTDLSQCLERTDAMNGSFYSECQKP